MRPTTFKRLWIYSLYFGLVLILAFLLREVFSGHIILSQYFNIGPLEIHYYGIIMALGVVAGFYLAIMRAPKYGVGLKQAEDILFWLVVGGFIGARLYHVFSSFGYYRLHPADIIKVWNGGLSIYGAVLGGLLMLWIVSQILNLKSSILNILDWLAPSLSLGQIIGRFGNFFNYEAFGYPTKLPWKMFVPYQFRPPGFENFSFFYPFFLYEAIGSAVILFLLLKVIKSKTPGTLFFCYLLLYNTLRFALEFLRIDSTFINGFRLNAVASLILVFISIIGLISVKHLHDKEP